MVQPGPLLLMVRMNHAGSRLWQLCICEAAVVDISDLVLGVGVCVDLFHRLMACSSLHLSFSGPLVKLANPTDWVTALPQAFLAHGDEQAFTRFMSRVLSVSGVVERCLPQSGLY